LRLKPGTYLHQLQNCNRYKKATDAYLTGVHPGGGHPGVMTGAIDDERDLE
jgi:hypothetical protein